MEGDGVGNKFHYAQPVVEFTSPSCASAGKQALQSDMGSDFVSDRNQGVSRLRRLGAEVRRGHLWFRNEIL